MKQNISERIISTLLVIVMLLGLMPVSAFAEKVFLEKMEITSNLSEIFVYGSTVTEPEISVSTPPRA